MKKSTNINTDYLLQRRKEIGASITEQRNAGMPITTAELAELVGVKTKTIEKIEAGEFDAKLDLLNSIGVALGSKLSYQDNDNQCVFG